ncbi:LysR family transcriptional regulator [Stenotrophomonas sp. NLF4-10]|uniref:LysR family transcriptional regulator n=1 Tax=Stenotrophomonas sp. NLF4-10 TaxID=2918754 RepID=UPI001EFBB3F9|nr:LysR family transcriptional regulator [Stenotrophomonas sp. NLF4-10]MCG8275472.1 LysR family transcriptional regulator [Stenotrophomonas sp. NLF4-10]
MKLRNLDDLNVFVQVIAAGSFSAAARMLHLSPKTVSKQIARIEQALGVILFERNTRNLRLTDEGRMLAERARAALVALDEMEELARDGHQGLRGVIRLTAPAPFGHKYVTAAIRDFRQLHPQVDFELRLSDQVQDLHGGNLDLAIRIGELADSRLVARRLAPNRRVLVASPDYLHAHGTPNAPDDLARYECLVFTYPGLLHDTWVLHNGRHKASVQIRGSLQSDNGDALRAWCLAGLGISLRETWDIHDALHAGTLVRVLPGWEAIPSNISLVRARREPLPRRLTMFMEFILARWQNAPWDMQDIAGKPSKRSKP